MKDRVFTDGGLILDSKNKTLTNMFRFILNLHQNWNTITNVFNIIYLGCI